MENSTPVNETCSSGEDLIRGRENAPGCKDVKKQITLLRERQASVLERARARRDRLHGAADRPIAEFHAEVKNISSCIQESRGVLSEVVRGEGTPLGNMRKIEVRIPYL